MKRQSRNISSSLLALITLLAMAPYDLGQVAMLFPPYLKPWFFILGALGTCASRIWGKKPEPEVTPTRPPPAIQKFYTFNFPPPPADSE